MEERYYQGVPQNNTDDRANKLFGRASARQQQAPPIPQQFVQNGSGGTTIYSPSTYEDVQLLIDHLKMKQQVIVNFASINRTSVYRILDFMSGAIYALDGSIQQIANDIFLFAPSGVKITTPDRR